MRRIQRVALWILGGSTFMILVAIGVISYSNSSEKQAWEQRKAERIAKGERYAWEELIPPKIPEAQNFAQAPMVKGAVLGKNLDPRFSAVTKEKAFDSKSLSFTPGFRLLPEGKSLLELQQALLAHRATLDEIAEAAQRPSSRLTTAYEEGEVPGLIGFRAVNRALQARACLALRKGDHASAASDVMTALRIADHMSKEPSLIPLLLQAALLGQAQQTIWEGLLDRRWTDHELSTFQGALHRVNLVASAHLAFEAERISMTQGLVALAEGKSMPKALSQEDLPKGSRLFGKGWIYRNLIELDRYYSACYLDPLDSVHQQVDPDQADRSRSWSADLKHRWDLRLAYIAMPDFSGILEKLARRQTDMNLALVACGLERHRLSKGAYPESLESLAPSYSPKVPKDLITGGPLHYRRDGRSFLLYSVGWDGIDDHGRPAPRPAGEMTESPKGDWVWFTSVQP